MENDARKEMIDELKAALAELESEDGLERFVEGHGLQSRFFAFSWSEERLELDFRLPYARVLEDEESQNADAAMVGAAIRLAILLLAVSGEGRLLNEGETRLSVTADEDGLRYGTQDADGVAIDTGDNWDSLVARLAAALPDDATASLQIIWP